MVLGLGSRSRKEQNPPCSSQSFDLDICLHEIRPWYGIHTSKTSSPVTLRWSRAGKPLASSKSVLPADSAILFNETLRVAGASCIIRSKKDKKASVDSEGVLLFSLLDSNNPKTQPLAQTGLNLAAFLSIQAPKTIAIPLTLSKKVSSKGCIFYLHLTVKKHKEDGDSLSQSDAVLSSTNSASSRHSDASTVPPLDEKTQQSLVAALLNGEEDEEVASFTDDDMSQGSRASRETESKKVADSMESVPENVTYLSPKNLADSRQPPFKKLSANPETSEVAEKRMAEANARLPRPALSTPQAMPVKAAAIAAASAYVPKQSFFSTNSNFIVSATSCDSCSDPESLEDDLMSALSVPTKKLNLQAMTATKSLTKETNNALSMKGAKMLDVKDDPEAFLGTGNSKWVGMQLLESSIPRNNPERKDPESNDIAERSNNPQLDNSIENVNNFHNKTGTMATKIGLQRGRSHEYEKKPVSEARSKPSNNSPARSSMRDTGPKAKTLISPDQKREKTGKHVESSPRTVTAEAKVNSLETEVERLKGELRDIAMVEVAVYSTTAEHGSSSFKIHAPARRLARMYIFAFKRCSKERRSSCAENAVAGLLLVARACGNDVSRLTFWWSNAVVLRESIAMALNLPYLLSDKHPHHRQSDLPMSLGASNDWGEAGTFIAALIRFEAWIYAKVLESVWWQILTLQMQKSENHGILDDDHGDDAGESSRITDKRKAGTVPVADFEDGMRKGNSVEIWKKAFSDAHERLCPVRGIGLECGCLPMISKMVLEECVARLDVAMFNAILRDEEAPTDPVSDPISDPCVLPVSMQSLSFGQGAQLKSAVATLSSWVSNLLCKDANSTLGDSNCENGDEQLVVFPMLKAMGGLLMLPKDMLIDKSLRKEVCPILSLPHIERILSKFKPDEYSPEPVSSDLLETINSEMTAEYVTAGEVADDESIFRIAIMPTARYMPPHSIVVKHWIGERTNQLIFGKSKSSLLRKGHTSDDEIDEMESPISWLVENTTVVGGHKNSNPNGAHFASLKGYNENCRFKLLREVWKMA